MPFLRKNSELVCQFTRCWPSTTCTLLKTSSLHRIDCPLGVWPLGCTSVLEYAYIHRLLGNNVGQRVHHWEISGVYSCIFFVCVWLCFGCESAGLTEGFLPMSAVSVWESACLTPCEYTKWCKRMPLNRLVFLEQHFLVCVRVKPLGTKASRSSGCSSA